MDGKAVATRLRQELSDQLASLATSPRLVLIGVGDDADSKRYVRQKRKMAQQVGISSEERWLPKGEVSDNVEAAVLEACKDPCVDGVLVQLPLPAHLDSRAVLDCITPEKDVDGLTSISLAGLAMGQFCYLPAAVAGIAHLLAHYGISARGKRAVVLGMDRFLSWPMAIWLGLQGALVSLLPDAVSESKEVCREADIIVVALGRPEVVGARWVKPGSVVIDTGQHRRGGELVGDVRLEEVMGQAAWITPVPGGVGPMIVAGLLKNTWAAHQRAQLRR